MIALADTRKAMAAALEGAGFNVSSGDDLTGPGALVGAFVVNYHPTIAGQPANGMARVGCEVRVAVMRAHEASANEALDAVLSSVWDVLEGAPGPWRSLVVQSARPDSPFIVGDASYASAALVVELYV